MTGPDGTMADWNESAIGVSTLFELLTAPTRRVILVELCDTEVMDVESVLAARNVVWATADPSGGPPVGPSTATSGEAVELYHNHLPKLEGTGVVEWDRETGVVTRGPAFAAVEPAIELLATNEAALPGHFV